MLDVYRRYKQFKPQGIAELNEGGLQLAGALANEIARCGRCVCGSVSMTVRRRHEWLTSRKKKVGIVACSGEELAEGTVTRLAALKVLEAAAPAGDGDDLPAAVPGRRRGRPGFCPLLPDHRRGWLRAALRRARYRDVFGQTGRQPGGD